LKSALPRKRRTGAKPEALRMDRPHDSNSQTGGRIMRYELADYEWLAIKPMLPNKPRGVPRVNDRRVLNGIFWVLRSGAPWRDCRIILAHTRPAITVSSAGGGPVSGAASSTHLPAPMMPLSR